MKSQCSCGLTSGSKNCPGWQMFHISVVTYCLPSSTSSVLQQLSSSLLLLMVSAKCSEKPTDRNWVGLQVISHPFPKQTTDMHWVNPNVWMSRSSCGQESRRHGGAMQWGQWASPTGCCGLWVWRWGGGGSAVTSAPVTPASLKIAKTNPQLQLSLASCWWSAFFISSPETLA